MSLTEVALNELRFDIFSILGLFKRKKKMHFTQRFLDIK